MRTVRLKIDAQVKKLLRHYSREYKVEDAGWTEDLYALIRMKGAGLPSKDRIMRMAKNAAKRRKGVSEVSVNMLITKRKMMFAGTVGTPYFQSLIQLPDPTEAASRFMANMRKLFCKTRQAQCLSCSLLKSCDFGKQYSAYFTDVTKVIDPDFANKAHKDCPHLPEIEGFNQMVEATKTMVASVAAALNQGQAALMQSVGGASPAELAEQAEDVGEPDLIEDNAQDPDSLADSDEDKADFYVGGIPPRRQKSSGKFNGSLDGDQLCRVSEKFIDQVSVTQLQIFELGKKFSQELTAQKAGKFKPVPQIEHDKAARPIEKESDLAQVTPSQHGLPTEVFDARLEKKTLTKTEYRKPEDKKKLIYLLIDASGSMLGQLGGSGQVKNGLFQRSTLATLFSVAVTKRVGLDKGIVYARFFTDSPGTLKSARQPDEFEALVNYLSISSSRSGGTSLITAIRRAASDIAAARDELHSAEILLITDAEDEINADEIKKALGETELNVLDVAGGSINSYAAKELKAMANKYYKANEAEPDITKIVSLV